jgi:hypothetical protein
MRSLPNHVWTRAEISSIRELTYFATALFNGIDDLLGKSKGHESNREAIENDQASKDATVQYMRRRLAYLLEQLTLYKERFVWGSLSPTLALIMLMLTTVRSAGGNSKTRLSHQKPRYNMSALVRPSSLFNKIFRPENALIDAAMRSNVARVQQLLNLGADPNYSTHYQNDPLFVGFPGTPLTAAISAQNVEVVQL